MRSMKQKFYYMNSEISFAHMIDWTNVHCTNAHFGTNVHSHFSVNEHLIYQSNFSLEDLLSTRTIFLNSSIIRLI